MIKISRIPAPVELTDEIITSLTAHFKATDESVWNENFIKEALMLMSSNKCCYCECKIDEESKYLEVEHFKPKFHFPDLVVVWSNLLPSCKHCNGHKKDINTEIEPIIDPTIDDPKLHLELRAYRMRPRNMSQLGKDTIDVLDLNDRERLVTKRFEIGDEIQTKLYHLVDDVKELFDLPNGMKRTRRKNKVISTIKNLLLEAQPSSEYSATAATVINSDIYYNIIKNDLRSLDLWSSELHELDTVIGINSLQ